MLTVRTSGLGAIHNDERLRLLRNNVEYLIPSAASKIFKLHDHKGDLSVYWFSAPKYADVKVLNELWSHFEPNEVIHFEITILEKEIRL